jgi:cysteine-rich repeat protein
VKRSFLLVAVALFGCRMKAASANYPDDPPNACMVFFSRGPSVGSALRAIGIYDDGRWIGSVRRGSYFAYQAAVGFHEFSVHGELTTKRSIQCKAGESFYFRASAEPGLFDAQFEIELDNDDGAAALGGLTYRVLRGTDGYSVDPNYQPPANIQNTIGGTTPKLPSYGAKETYDPNRAPVCGNGFLERGEQCDKGKDNADAIPNACRLSCTLYRCGDGVLDGTETCDDGNTVDGDGCPASCVNKLSTCGNGAIDTGEECDDGSANSDEYGPCLSICRSKPKAPEPVCGNLVVEETEQCDDGNDKNDDLCRNNCQLPRCGDGFIDKGEACDDGNTKNYDSCNKTCTKRTIQQ